MKVPIFAIWIKLIFFILFFLKEKYIIKQRSHGLSLNIKLIHLPQDNIQLRFVSLNIIYLGWINFDIQPKAIFHIVKKVEQVKK